MNEEHDIAGLNKDDKTYGGWKVSNIYKKLMAEVFTLNEVYKGYTGVFSKIDGCLKKEKCDEVKAIIERAKKLIV